MAQAGIYTPTSVVRPDLEVTVNGIVRPTLGLDFGTDTTGGLPDQVVSAGTGMKSTTGQIDWAPLDVVTRESPHPVTQADGWPPREGDKVVITSRVDTGSGEYTYRRFTGRLGRTTGSLTNGDLSSQITSTLGDALQKVVTVPPTIADARHYMRSAWTAYQAMGQAGLTTIPAPNSSTILWNGYQYGLRPLVGKFRASGIGYGDPYGVLANSNVQTDPDGTPRAGRNVLVVAGGSSVWSSELRVNFGPHLLKLAYDVDSRIYTFSTSNAGVLWTGARTDDNPLPTLAFYVRSNGITIWTGPDDYEAIDYTYATDNEVGTVGGDRLTGITVAYNRGFSAAAYVASVAERPASVTQWSNLEQDRIPATRGFENVKARTVVDEWSEATLGSVWQDEFGKPLMVARDRLVSRAPARTVEVDERLFSGAWSVGHDSTRSGVQIDGLQSAIQSTGRAGAYFTAWQETSARGFDTAETTERFLEAPDDTDWGPIDTNFERFGSGGGRNVGLIGSWVSAVVTANSDDVERWAQHEGVIYTASVQRLGQRTLKLAEAISGIPSNSTVYLKTATTGTEQTHPAMRGLPMPVIRAEWITTWADYTLTGATEGPMWAAPLELDVGWWLTPADAQRVADALAVEVTLPMPTITGATVLWDPRRQIGDVEEWIARTGSGDISWTARVLVTGYSESWEGNVPSQSVDVRVITLVDPRAGKTYTDLAAAYTRFSDMTPHTFGAVYDALPNQA